MDNENLVILNFSNHQKSVNNFLQDNQAFIKSYSDLQNNNCWSQTESQKFLVRSKNYLVDNIKFPSKDTLLETIACKLIPFNSKNKDNHHNLTKDIKSILNHISNHENSNEKESELFIITFLVPGYKVSWIYREKKDDPKNSNYISFWKEFYHHQDDEYRNKRFKLLPDIPNGNWIVKQTIGNKPAIISKTIKTTWNRQKNYLEVIYDVSTSFIGNRIFNVVKHYAKTIILDLAFIIEAQTEDELPERVLCSTRMHQIDLDLINK